MCNWSAWNPPPGCPPPHRRPPAAAPGPRPGRPPSGPLLAPCTSTPASPSLQQPQRWARQSGGWCGGGRRRPLPLDTLASTQPCLTLLPRAALQTDEVVEEVVEEDIEEDIEEVPTSVS